MFREDMIKEITDLVRSTRNATRKSHRECAEDILGRLEKLGMAPPEVITDDIPIYSSDCPEGMISYERIWEEDIQ